MPTDLRPSHERPKPLSALAGAPVMGPLYIVENAGVYEFRDDGPADAYLELVSGVFEVNPTAAAHDGSPRVIAGVAELRG